MVKINKQKEDDKKTITQKTDIENNQKSKENVLKKKIADYDQIICEYDVLDENPTSRIILRRMSESLEEYIKIILQILQPEEFHSLHECTNFDDYDKAKLLELFKKMMIVHREILLAIVNNVELSNIKSIASANAQIQSFKPEIIIVINKMLVSWKEIQTHGKLGYVG